MGFPEDQLAELKHLGSEVFKCDEGGITYFLLKGLKLPEGCKPQEVEALLCPSQRDGYNSRLFFGEKIATSKNLNWNGNNVRILERNWFAYSWRVNQTNLRLAQLIATHLGALR